MDVFSIALNSAFDPAGAVSRAIYETVNLMLSGTLNLSDAEKKDIHDRAQLASTYLSEAGQILGELQHELSERSSELASMLTQIESTRAEAAHWEEIASTNEELAAALTTEIERRVGAQLREELRRGQKTRRILAFLVWILTIIASGIAGVYAQRILEGQQLPLP